LIKTLKLVKNITFGEYVKPDDNNVLDTEFVLQTQRRILSHKQEDWST